MSGPGRGRAADTTGADLAVDGEVIAANVVRFGRALRGAGLPVSAADTRTFAHVLTLIGVAQRGDVQAAGRCIFVKRREELAVYDAVFDLFWRRAIASGGVSEQFPRIRQKETPRRDVAFGREVTPSAVGPEPGQVAQPVAASVDERIRTADFAELTVEEARDALAMLEALTPRLPLRPSRRRRLARTGGRLAARLMTRRSLGAGGEVLWWRRLARTRRPRPIVLVCDISGSMQRYTRFLLRFAHALARSGARVETFVFGTSLTRITRELRVRDADAAVRQVADKVMDWSGGTKIGASLHMLNRHWVRRTVRSGAVVLLASDGWERDDPRRLSREMELLRRACHRIIWLDPLAARPGFTAATAGLLAALPHVDAFLPCASVASLEELACWLAELVA